MSNEREAKLPRWAQAELRRLRAQVETLERSSAELRAEVGDTDVHVLNYERANQPLPKNARIEFRLGDRYDQVIQVARDDDTVRISGHRGICVIPVVSNVVAVRLRD